MIRWSEETEAYRLEYSHQYQAAAAGVLAVAMGVATLATFLGAAWAFEKHLHASAVAILALGVVAGGVGWLAGRECATYGSRRGWVEVSVRGGTARWGSPSLPPMEAPIPVSYFRLAYDARGRSGIEAVLPDGGHRHVLGLWGDDQAARRIKLVEELNANLGTVESSAATVVPPMARLTGEPDATAQRSLGEWRSSPLPHRLVVVDHGWVGVVIAVAAVLLLVGWSTLDPAPCAVLALLLLCVGAGLTWLAEWRYARWIEIVATEGRVRWGRGRDLILGEDAVAAFQAEPQQLFFGPSSAWSVVGYRADGSRVVPFGPSIRLSLQRAARTAWLLNQALAQCPAGEASSSR